MQWAHCTDCQTDVRLVREEKDNGSYTLKRKCECTEASVGTPIHEVGGDPGGWGWLAEMDEDEWHDLQEQITDNVNKSIDENFPDDAGRLS